MEKLIRKLAVILATDCVGFSKMMDKNEELTLQNIKLCRQIIDPIIQENGGRIFHTAGDSVIAEFNSVVDAVNAAIEFQKMLHERNEEIKRPTTDKEINPILFFFLELYICKPENKSDIQSARFPKEGAIITYNTTI